MCVCVCVCVFYQYLERSVYEKTIVTLSYAVK